MKASFLFLCMLVFGAECLQQIILQDEDPDHPRQCYNEWEKKYYNVGEEMKKQGSECVRIICSGLIQDSKMEITKIFCSPPRRRCLGFQGDLKKDYPGPPQTKQDLSLVGLGSRNLIKRLLRSQ